jgi:outer membrane protein assembly factor BamB
MYTKIKENEILGKIKSKTTAAILALFLTLTIAITLVASPAANAHDPTWTIVSYAYVQAGPNPVGVGQSVLIFMWVDGPMPASSLDNDVRRHDYTLTITAPDGKKETKNWAVVADPTSCQFIRYTPTQVGTYTLEFDYPGQTYTWDDPIPSYFGPPQPNPWTNDVFTAANATFLLTVQEEQLPSPTNSYPLPTEYWTRPIEGQNTDWYKISSNWLGEPFITSGASIGGGTAGLYIARTQPDGIAPNSPHIMWSKPLQDGGVVGGNNTAILGEMYYTGGSYNTRMSNALIMYGRLYYELPYGNSGGGGGWMCVDLRTGEEIWYNPDIGRSGSGLPDLNFGLLPSLDTANQHGILPNGILFSSNFARSYDPTTGQPTPLNVTNVPRTDTNLAAVPGPNGEVIRYDVVNIGNASNPDWRLLEWNSSKAVGGAGGIGAGGWYSGEIDASLPSMYDYNISITLPNSDSWRVDRASLDNIMLLVQGSFGGHPTATFGSVSLEGANVTAISLKPNSRGQVLWTKHYPPAPGNVTRGLANWDPERGIFILYDKETRTMSGYSLDNGEHVWGPVESMNDYIYFRNYPAVAYGKVYMTGYGGILYCYDVTNGDLLWTYGNGGPGNSTFAGLETSYGTYPYNIDVIADGKLYLGTTEHSPNSPLYKDAKYRCINATDGTEIWTLMGWATGMDATYDRIADGFFVFLNTYDMQIYSVGKGPSATTVEAPMTAISQGESLMIRGTVMDIAAGTKQKEQAARFPNGVPAVSDESMGEWMEYVYMQKPRPTDVTGVEVTLSVLDPNGNVYDIGNVTTDAAGMFKLLWEPLVPGEYTVIARFAGTESYWPSYAETAVGVTEAPVATPPPTPTPAPMTDMYLFGATTGIIIAIVVVGLVLVLMLRKR